MEKEEMEKLLIKIYKNAQIIQKIMDIGIEVADKHGRIPGHQVAKVIEQEFKDAIQKGIIDKIPIELKLSEDAQKNTNEEITNPSQEK